MRNISDWLRRSDVRLRSISCVLYGIVSSSGCLMRSSHLVWTNVLMKFIIGLCPERSFLDEACLRSSRSFLIKITCGIPCVASTENVLKLYLLSSSLEELHLTSILKSISHLLVSYLDHLYIVYLRCFLPLIVRDVKVLLWLSSLDIAHSHKSLCVFVSSLQPFVHKVNSRRSHFKDRIL